MSSSTKSMDISETFRPEDLSKTDFFDYVTGPAMTMNVDETNRAAENSTESTIQQPLQGFDQVKLKSTTKLILLQI